jgi:hypothetical protein
VYERGTRGPGDAYDVLCVQLDGTRERDGHEHVTFVDTRDPDGAQTRWKSVDVIAAIRDGAEFVVAEDGKGRRTLLQPALCPACPFATLEVEPPAPRPIGCD